MKRYIIKSNGNSVVGRIKDFETATNRYNQLAETTHADKNLVLYECICLPSGTVTHKKVIQSINL